MILTTARDVATHMTPNVRQITACRLLRSCTNVYDSLLMGLGRLESATTKAKAIVRNKVTTAVDNRVINTFLPLFKLKNQMITCYNKFLCTNLLVS